MVNDLSDLEICKRIAKIEHPNHTVYCDSGNSLTIRIPRPIDFNPLFDDALCFQLMVKYGVERTYEPYDCLGWHCKVFDSKSPSAVLELNCTYNDVVEISPNRAICLAIIEANKD